MDSKKLRQEFLKFFEKKGHHIVPSSSLLPTDSSVLLTTAGMQQFKEYFLGKKSPFGNRVASCQKCFRTSDIDNVGDISHLTFLEMLGSFSFGDYFKEGAIKLAYQFLIDICKLKIENLTFTYFKGDGEVPEDSESKNIWLKLGIPEDKITGRGREDNFWGPTGEEGPCGPTTEIYINGTEVWNIVFNEHFQDKDKKLTPLKQKGVDTGMGLERLAMAIQNKPNVFETDLFKPLMEILPDSLPERQKRIVVDHARGIVFLISDGIRPFNKEAGYVLRRMLRRLIVLMKDGLDPKKLFDLVVKKYQDFYPNLDKNTVNAVFDEEYRKFNQALKKGLAELEKMVEIDAQNAFKLYESFGLPYEVIKEIGGAKAVALKREDFDKELEAHQAVSRAGAQSKFGGGGAFSPRLHTATHLLQAALRSVLGSHIQQMGSDITSSRLRFDFAHPQKMSEAEIKKVEALVNQKIEEDLEVKKAEMSYNEAIKQGVLAFFKEKYPEKVTVYSIDDFSKEICAGPHAQRTGELGFLKIIKEESSGAGIRRIKAIIYGQQEEDF